MTKKDFQLIAKVLSDAHYYAASVEEQAVIEALAKRFAGNLANLNPRFDRERFIAAAINDSNK